jgi:hypothetical protein
MSHPIAIVAQTLKKIRTEKTDDTYAHRLAREFCYLCNVQETSDLGRVRPVTERRLARLSRLMVMSCPRKKL